MNILVRFFVLLCYRFSYLFAAVREASFNVGIVAVFEDIHNRKKSKSNNASLPGFLSMAP